MPTLDAYAARATEYIELFGDIDAAAEEDRVALLAWAKSVDGPIIDVGCGPGQWTSFLHAHGVDIEGVDPVAVFIDEARRRHPEARYRLGTAEALKVDDASLGGILSWFSLIHTTPDRIADALTEFARALREGGGLAIGFFEGVELEPFDHAVVTAYRWPVDALCERIEAAGFVIGETQTRTDAGTRPQGTILATRA